MDNKITHKPHAKNQFQSVLINRIGNNECTHNIDLDVLGNQVLNVADGNNSGDAANMRTAQRLLANPPTASMPVFIPLTGSDTIFVTGDIEFNGSASLNNVNGINMNGLRITGVRDPVALTDLLSLGAAEDALFNYGDNRYVRSSGSTMLGTLDMNNNSIVRIIDAVEDGDGVSGTFAETIGIPLGGETTEIVTGDLVFSGFGGCMFVGSLDCSNNYITGTSMPVTIWDAVSLEAFNKRVLNFTGTPQGIPVTGDLFFDTTAKINSYGIVMNKSLFSNVAAGTAPSDAAVFDTIPNPLYVSRSQSNGNTVIQSGNPMNLIDGASLSGSPDYETHLPITDGSQGVLFIRNCNQHINVDGLFLLNFFFIISHTSTSNFYKYGVELHHNPAHDNDYELISSGRVQRNAISNTTISHTALISIKRTAPTDTVFIRIKNYSTSSLVVLTFGIALQQFSQIS